MTTYISQPIVSGTKTYYHLTGDTDKEVIRMAERVKSKRPRKQHGRLHFDLSPKQAHLAFIYGCDTEKSVNKGGDV